MDLSLIRIRIYIRSKPFSKSDLGLDNRSYNFTRECYFMLKKIIIKHYFSFFSFKPLISCPHLSITIETIKLKIQYILKVQSARKNYTMLKRKQFSHGTCIEMVTQKQVRTSGSLLFDMFKAFGQIEGSHKSRFFFNPKRPIFLHECSTCSDRYHPL